MTIVIEPTRIKQSIYFLVPKNIADFGDYFKKELTLVDDYDLIQEVAIMEKLADYSI